MMSKLTIDGYNISDKEPLPTDDGLEKEDTGDFNITEDEIKPFDSKKVDVSIITPNLGTLIRRLEYNEINLMPDFQRSGDLWSKQMQSRLIESILIRLPIPAFYFDVLSNDRWQVVDGLQRLSTIKNFVIEKENKRLHLTNLEFLTELEGNTYDELPREFQRRIDEFQVSAYLIRPGTPSQMKYALFNRINTGGLKLSHQEIRHAMSQSIDQGRASKFLNDLVEDEIFKIVVGKNKKRMSYHELVLRHIAFVLSDTIEYKSSLPKFLDIAMDKLGQLSEEKYSNIKTNLLDSLKTANIIFGDHAFRKSLINTDNKKVVNKPLFESLSVCLSKITSEERAELINKKYDFKNNFKKMMADKEFEQSISISTSNTDNVKIRFKKIQKIIKEFLSTGDLIC